MLRRKHIHFCRDEDDPALRRGRADRARLYVAALAGLVSPGPRKIGGKVAHVLQRSHVSS